MTLALLLVDHGSRRAGANNLLRAIALRLDERLRSQPATAPFAFCEHCHMELCEPSIAQGLATCVERGATEVVVMPYFLAPGRHSRSDIPQMTAEAAAAFPNLRFTVSPPLGLHDKIMDVVIERAVEGLERGLTTVDTPAPVSEASF